PERQAAAADAFGEPGLEPLELCDALVDARAPFTREPRPILTRGGAARGQLGERGADLVERKSDALGEHDEGDAPQHRARKAAMAGARALGPDEPARLVEAQRRGGHPAAPGNLLDGEQVVHAASLGQTGLDFKLT